MYRLFVAITHSNSTIMQLQKESIKSWILWRIFNVNATNKSDPVIVKRFYLW